MVNPGGQGATERQQLRVPFDDGRRPSAGGWHCARGHRAASDAVAGRTTPTAGQRHCSSHRRLSIGGLLVRRPSASTDRQAARTWFYLGFRVPPAGLEPAAYRLGGGRSIHLSYEGPPRNVEQDRAAASHRAERQATNPGQALHLTDECGRTIGRVIDVPVGHLFLGEHLDPARGSATASPSCSRQPTPRPTASSSA
jgi:hypothetical protein